jgi:hypothetical protein
MILGEIRTFPRADDSASYKVKVLGTELSELTMRRLGFTFYFTSLRVLVSRVLVLSWRKGKAPIYCHRDIRTQNDLLQTSALLLLCLILNWSRSSQRNFPQYYNCPFLLFPGVAPWGGSASADVGSICRRRIIMFIREPRNYTLVNSSLFSTTELTRAEWMMNGLDLFNWYLSN